MQGYCMKCRTKKEIKNAKAVTMKTKRPATQGDCSTCGTKSFKIGKASVQFVMGYNATPSGQERVIYPEQQIESDKDKTANYLDNVGKQMKKQGINTKSEVRFGDAAEEIIKFANEIDADMVALCTHARAGIDRLVFGTDAFPATEFVDCHFPTKPLQHNTDLLLWSVLPPGRYPNLLHKAPGLLGSGLGSISFVFIFLRHNSLLSLFSQLLPLKELVPPV
jgi:hypothetical protein